ncbi:hypothetical protein CQA53_00555 [Helicobacter didelphidarum]|uniref:Uncharacterized protein n=1 Tax=Helicobacter didelphidarum TaxID=2040648 RepID=A0A3D8ISE9_9HELI|nr:tetratricopeptide repeat protein [Helicobacter didelphidarum]RDU67544.1 hypothetical protein CQA53_00555 [Helicobacter didelphidarum]
MSRKLLNLGYIYEMVNKHNEALVCFEQVLEKDSRSLNTEIIKEARLGIKANHMALKYQENPELLTKNLDMEKMQRKIQQFRQDPRKLIGWFSQWS